MKATEQYFPVVLFIVLYKAILTFSNNVAGTLGFVDEILNCDYSNESSYSGPFIKENVRKSSPFQVLGTKMTRYLSSVKTLQH